MNKQELKNHCEKQINLCLALNDYKHIEEHKAVLNLIEENQKLKNQLSNSHQMKNQQKEFIKYLEDFINKTDYEINILGNYPYLAWSKAYQKILSKYKEIIGVSK